MLLLSCLLAFSPVWASDEGDPPVAVEIRLDFQGETPQEIGAKLLLEPISPEREARPAREVELDDPLHSTSLRAGDWRFCAYVPGWWSLCRRVNLEASQDDRVSVVALPLWPAGRVEGHLKEPRGAREAREETWAEVVRVEFSDSDPVRRTLPTSEVRCPVDEGGRWACAMPAGRLDLAVRPVGFVPSYRWGVDIEKGEAIDLGVFELRRGASLAGRVEAELGAVDPERCVATLQPAVAAGPGTARAQRVAELDHRARVDARGNFQFVGVPPGTYVLEVTQPGASPARVFPVEIHEEAETVLGDPVVLRRPVAVTLDLEPPVDWAERPWRVTLTPAGDVGGRIETARPIEGLTDEAGRVVFPGQTPGVFALRVEDSTGQGFFFDPAFAAVDALAAHRRIELSLATVFGRVRWGDEALPGARLWFGGRSSAVGVSTQADDEGAFAVVLPRAGRWSVDLEADAPEVRVRTKVEVEPDGNGYADLVIELPATELFGAVVDGLGQPVADAAVGVQSEEGSAEATTDGEGGFSVRGFAAGPVSVRAWKRTGEGAQTADTLLATVSEDRAYGPVRLQLVGSRELEGRVLSAAGHPVAGAVIEATSPEPGLFVDTSRSGLEGEFSIRVRDGTTRLKMIVAAPGHPLLVSELEPTGPVTLRLEGQAGELAIDGPRPGEVPGVSLVLYKDGLAIPPATLWQWARLQGRPPDPERGWISVPAMPVGSYALCATAGSAVSGSPELGSEAAGCVEGFLNPGSALVLTPEPCRAQSSSAPSPVSPLPSARRP